MIKRLFFQYKEAINYLIFGVCSTAINIGLYALFYQALHFENVPSNILAWIIAVLFAFVTNKIWVFESRSLKPSILFYEISTFFGCRLLTGLLDLAIMFVSVDLFGLNGILFKCISNILVIILNYIASKILIFNTKRKERT